jgi:predicted PurR-regulated permease PerM
VSDEPTPPASSGSRLQPQQPQPVSRGLVWDLWTTAWGRVLLISATIGMVSWAMRETAVITGPVFHAIGAVALPLAVGFTIAYVLSPVVDVLQRLHIGRFLAAVLLYLVISLLVALGAVLLVPAVGHQSAELFGRTFEDVYYYDRDGDGVRDPSEPDLVVAVGPPRVYYEARDGADAPLPNQQQWGDVDVARRPGESGVRMQQSLVKYVVSWIDATQGQMEQILGHGLGDRGRALLARYLTYTRTPWEALAQGLEIAQHGDEAAIRNWLQRPAPPTEAAVWDPEWPGPTPQQIEGGYVAVADQDLRKAWEAQMVRWGAELALRHAEVIDALVQVRSDGTGESELARDIRSALELAPVPKDPELVAEAYARLSNSSRSADRELLRAIYVAVGSADESSLQQALRSMYQGVRQEIKAIPDVARAWATSLAQNIGQVFLVGLDIILVPIYAFFLTLGMPQIRRTTRRFLPRWQRDRTVRLLHDIERVVAAFFRGRLIVCLICGLLVYVGFVIIGVPYAGLFAIAIGLATTIPLAGLLFLVPAVLLTLIGGGENLGLRVSAAVLVYIVVQTLEAVVFTPTIMGREVELHPVVLIIALLLCGKLLGVLGLILAVPIAATIRILAREFLLPRLRRVAKEPGPTEPPPPAPPREGVAHAH